MGGSCRFLFPPQKKTQIGDFRQVSPNSAKFLNRHISLIFHLKHCVKNRNLTRVTFFIVSLDFYILQVFWHPPSTFSRNSKNDDFIILYVCVNWKYGENSEKCERGYHHTCKIDLELEMELDLDLDLELSFGHLELSFAGILYTPSPSTFSRNSKNDDFIVL